MYQRNFCLEIVVDLYSQFHLDCCFQEQVQVKVQLKLILDYWTLGGDDLPQGHHSL